MKAEILKIAGVKSEKEFYKKYPTEEAFMKAHKKEFKKAAMGAKMVKTQLEQLTDFGNPPKAVDGIDMWGNPLPIIQQVATPNSIYNPQFQQLGLNAPSNGSIPNPNLDTQNTLWGTGESITQTPTLGGTTPASIQGMNLQSFGKSNTGLIDKLGGYSAIGKTAGDLIGGFKRLKAEKEARRKAQAWAKVSGVAKQAQASMPKDIVKQNFLRPEDRMVQPNQLFPSYGIGTNYLAKDGTKVMKIGGNLTEIQNTYAPNTLYNNLGYEPLDESNQVKQFEVGGDLSKFSAAGGFDMLDTFGDLAIQNNAGGDIGGTIGGTAGGLIGTAVAGPVGKAIGEKIGKIGGKTIGKLIDTNPKRMRAAQEKTKSNVGAMAFGMNAQDIQQGQFSGFVRNGGNIPGYEEGGWVSHDWQPQVITQFGEHNMKDLLKADPMMDTLRTGGNITQNNMFPTDQYALGGELKTTWGGYAEPISYNPYMPGSGETVMFRGKSHEESDGRGHTGIGVKYGEGGKMTDYAEFGSRDADADVEVERGEPATEMIDGQTGEKNMVVFGNLKIPNMFLDQIGDVKAKNKKFKNYVADLGKMEAKQNKIIEKATDNINRLDPHTQYELLEQYGNEANIIGAKMNLKNAALRKSNAAAVQNAINDTAAEHGLDADHLAKGKVKIDKEAMKQQAKYGKEIMKAQTGKNFQSEKEIADYYKSMGYTGPNNIDSLQKWIIQQAKSNPEVDKELTSYLQGVDITNKGKRVYGKNKKASELTKDQLYDQFNDKLWGYRFPKLKSLLPEYEGEIPLVDISGPWDEEDSETKDSSVTTTNTQTTTKPNWMDMVNNLLPYLRPSNQEAFDYGQIAPELMAMATNQLDPVQAQLYRPELTTPFDISLQDQMNANQADFNALQRTMGYNPAALSALAAQKYAANSGVLGEQFRLNQAEKNRVYEGNRAVLNDAQLKNLGILDTQMTRQSQAKSLTKQQNIEAMKSIADKIAKNKLENRTLGIYENLYNYRFDPITGRAINMNPLALFDRFGSMGSSKTGGLASGLEFTYDANGNIVGTRKSKEEAKHGTKLKKESRNGSIVKAIKNL